MNLDLHDSRHWGAQEIGTNVDRNMIYAFIEYIMVISVLRKVQFIMKIQSLIRYELPLGMW